MTATEKLDRIKVLTDKAKTVFGMTWQEADEIEELRKGLKVSDWFLWIGETEGSLECFYKIMGFETRPLGRWHQGLQDAINSGYVTTYDYKQHGRYHWMVKLTRTGKRLLKM